MSTKETARIGKAPRIGPIAMLAAAAAVGVALSALAGAASARDASGSATVLTKTVKLGRILVDSRGHTLYLFEKDKGGRSACYSTCAKFWPPLLTSGKPSAGPGVKASLLGVTMRTGGGHQVTYAGHPLYRYSLDTKPGQTKGEASKLFGAEWYVVAPSGKKIDNS